MIKMLKYYIALVVLSTLAVHCVWSQSYPDRFDDQIVEFEEMDQSDGYKPDAIFFTGSSSIRMWSTLEDDMSPMSVVNRGFGGSTIPEVLFYADRLIKPHEPKMIVFYCGDNDLSNDTTTAEDVLQSFKEFDQWLKTNLPDSRLYFISIKPSVKRWQYWPKMHKANQLIANYMIKESRLRFIDVSSAMLDKKGNVKDDLFLEDMLHLNEKGYKGWAKTVKSSLSDTYDILYSN